MGKVKILLVLVLGFFMVSGCVTLDEIKAKLTPKSKAKVAQPKQKAEAQQYTLTAEQRYHLNTWQHAAKLAEEVNDSETAILYYTKIKEFFPHTQEGMEAQLRINCLTQAKEK